MTASAAPAAAGFFGDVQKKWGWLLAMGIVAIALGTFGLGRAVALTLVGVLFYGWLILISGVLQASPTRESASAQRAEGERSSSG